MIRSGDTLHNPVTGETLHFVTSASDTNGEYVLVEAVIELHGFVAAAHMHPFQTEVFEVLEGTIEFKAGGKTIVAGPGEKVVVEPVRRTRSEMPATRSPASGARCGRRSSSSS